MSFQHSAQFVCTPEAAGHVDLQLCLQGRLCMPDGCLRLQAM